MTPAPNAAGWNNTDVTVSWSVSDPESGIDSSIGCSTTLETASTTLTCSATNGAGLSTSVSVTVKIDKTRPTITATQSPPPNATGWNNTNVTVTFTCADTGSGITTCPAPVTVTTEGAGQVVTATAIDVAGNSAVASVTVNLDKTAPTLTFGPVTPAPNAAGWNNTNVAISFTVTDALSGIAGTSIPSPLVLSAEGTAVTGQVTVTDVAGNSATFTSSAVTIDKTPPTVTFGSAAPAPNAAGWNNTNVSISFTAADNLSGVAATTPAASPLVLTTEGMAVTGTVTVTDVAGNHATVTSPAVKIDKTPPSLTATRTPAPNAAGWNNTDVTAIFTCTDGLSGVATCAAPTTVSTEGANQSVRGSGTDQAGNSANVTVTVNLDKTPPEAINQFDPTTRDVAVLGRDRLSGVLTGPIAPLSVVPTRWGKGDDDGDDHDERGNAELRTYLIQDVAGNTLRLVEIVKREGHELKAQIVSLQYQSGRVLTPLPNKKAFEWALTKAGSLKELEQKIKVGKGKEKQEVKAKFEGKKNQTTIKVEDSRPEVKVVKPGLVLLRLATSNGTLVIEF